jgi:hypothetical protein
MASDCSTDFVLPSGVSNDPRVTGWAQAVADASGQPDAAEPLVPLRDPCVRAHVRSLVTDRGRQDPTPTDNPQGRPASVVSTSSRASASSRRRSFLGDLASAVSPTPRRASVVSVRTVPRPPRSSVGRKEPPAVPAPTPALCSPPHSRGGQRVGVLPSATESSVCARELDTSTVLGSVHPAESISQVGVPRYPSPPLCECDDPVCMGTRVQGVQEVPSQFFRPGLQVPAPGGAPAPSEPSYASSKHSDMAPLLSGAQHHRRDSGHASSRGRLCAPLRHDNRETYHSDASCPPPPQSIADTRCTIDMFADEVARRVHQRIGTVRADVPVVTGASATTATHRRSRFTRPAGGAGRLAVAVAAYNAGRRWEPLPPGTS